MILVGDVGGTRTRLACARRGRDGWRLDLLRESPTSADLAGQVAAYRATLRGAAIEAAGFCGAGPVGTRGAIRLTNRDCRLVPRALARAAGVATVVTANDFGAVAHAVRNLRAGDRRRFAGPAPRAGTTRLVIGPGTGLGVATIAAGPAGTILAGEGGHADLAAAAADEAAVLARLRRRQRRVSAETALSGPGLERIFVALGGRPDAAPAIADAAWRGERRARRAVALFTRWLGHFAASLALTAGATGGVYLAGGIIPAWGRRFDASAFRAAFVDHPRHGHWLARVPLFVVRHPQPGLLGMALLAHERLRLVRATHAPAKVY